MSARVAGGGAQRWARCLGLVVLAALACAAVGQQQDDPCPDTTFLKQRKADDTKGHFLSATMSWTHVSGNKVRFEVISTWRRKHYWPCKAGLRSEGAGFTGPDGWPGVGDDLTVVGLSTVDTGQARQEAVGTVSTKLHFGERSSRSTHRTLRAPGCLAGLRSPCACSRDVHVTRRRKLPRAAPHSDFILYRRGLADGRFLHRT